VASGSRRCRGSVAEGVRRALRLGDVGESSNRDSFGEDFAQDLSPKGAAAMAAVQEAVTLDILFTPSGSVAWQEGLPSWYACRRLNG
jgi:hypothetical protein